MDRRRFLAAAGAAASLTLAGCGSASGQDYAVGMTGTAFRPYTVTVSVGEEVVWKNTSTRDHTVTAYDGRIPEAAEYFATGGYESEEAAREAWQGSEGAISNGDYYRHAFEVAGTYDYLCIPHEASGMTGRVVVEE